jgi:hypothetical protein
MSESHWIVTIRVRKPKRSCLQFRLRSLLVAALAVAVMTTLLLKLQPKRCDHAIFDGAPFTSHQQLHEALKAFAAAGLDHYEIRGMKVFVPTCDRERYLAVMREANCLLPAGRPADNTSSGSTIPGDP